MTPEQEESLINQLVRWERQMNNWSYDSPMWSRLDAKCVGLAKGVQLLYGQEVIAHIWREVDKRLGRYQEESGS